MTDLIVDRLPVTAQLAMGAFIIWIVVGVSVGIVAALKRGKWQDRSIMGVALIGYSFPSFFIALLLIFFVQLQLELIPFVNYEPGMIFTDPVGWFQVFILPWTALALPLRRVLRPADPQPDAGDPGRGLHPHRPGQGPAPSGP